MNANKFSDSMESDLLEVKFHHLIGLKPPFNGNKPERYLTYYLMLKDILDNNRTDMILFIKCGIIKKKCINKIFKVLISLDSTSLLNNYLEIIEHYENEDLKEYYFA